MNRFHSGLTAREQRARWSRRLFFLDLDGVFDCEALGFPHTTPSGVAALELEGLRRAVDEHEQPNGSARFVAGDGRRFGALLRHSFEDTFRINRR